MSIDKSETVDMLLAAKEAVSIARTGAGLSEQEKQLLESIAVKLHHSERILIKTLQQEMLDELKSDAQELQDLTAQMDLASSNLGQLANKIKACSKAMEMLISAIIAAGKVGLV